MRNRGIAVLLMTVLFLSFLAACGKSEPMPVVPDIPQLPGTLVGVSYAHGSGMVHRADFRIRLNRNEIEYTNFWPMDIEIEEMQERSHVSISEDQWNEIEELLLELYRGGCLVERETSSVKSEGSDALILDGGDFTSLSLTWETEEGLVEVRYIWPSDRRVLTLIDLLQELADPQGREIVRYERPEIHRIYFSKKHRFNHKNDFSFQLHWTEYDGEDAHWELIYYLGKIGVGENGRIPLTEADWEAFLSLTEELQLEYFPETTKSDDWFTCKLSYTDDTSKSVALNKNTEEKLKAFFLNLLN